MSLFWPFQSTIDVNRIAANILYEHQFDAEFSNLTGEYYNKYWGTAVENQFDSENPTVSGMVVEHTDLKLNGGSTLDIPILTVDNTGPTYGDADMQNQGSKGNIVFTTVGLNSMAFAHDLIPKFSMQAQVLGPKATAELNRAQESLKWRLTRTMDQDLYHTMFYGGSRHTTATDDNTLPNIRQFITPHSHANFVVKNGGEITQISYANGKPGGAAYETDVVGGLNLVEETDVFDTAYIEELEFLATRLKIPMFQTKFGERRILLVSDVAMKQLNQDPVYRAAKQEAFSTQGWDANAFKNYRAQWSQTLVFSSVRIPGVRLLNNEFGNVVTQTAGNGMPFYHPSGWFDDINLIDSSPLRTGILCAPGMIQKAYGQAPVSIEHAKYPGSLKEQLILRATMAYAISDLTDRDGRLPGNTPGTSAFYTNQSSLVFAHGSKAL